MVVDTGVLFAVADEADHDHDACDELLAAHPGELVVPTPVIVESSWLIEDRLGPAAEAAFLRSVTSGELTRVDLDAAGWERVVELVETYADLGGWMEGRGGGRDGGGDGPGRGGAAW